MMDRQNHRQSLFR